MGLLQLALDAWLGTTGFALGRRVGVFAAPRLENVRHEIVRDVLRRYLRLGETSLDNIEAAREAFQRRAEPGSRNALAAKGSLAAQRFGIEAKNAARHGTVVAERLLRQLRERLR
mmetsp:Transcript_94017/g.275176  ORF Transcript_94017/g.275176 Transcript_94017/m.275176 type:complete len:115 (+) Transcript_94017:73-417(+)